MKNGKIVQVMGPVIDVEFEDELPKIKDALEVELDGKKLVMEVSQHIGGNCVRCIMLAGLCQTFPLVTFDLTQQKQLTHSTGGLLDAHDAGRQDLGIVYHQQVARL